MAPAIPRVLVRLSAFGTLVGGVIALKEYLGGANYSGTEKLQGKTVIITGANTGIGLETARDMARRGAKVILACRDMEKCKKARKDIALDTRNKNIFCKECDLASQESIRNFAKVVNENEPNVDILINNAGVMRCKYLKTKEGIELQLGTNHMGHFLLTNLLLEKIKESSPSRIVNVSSVAHLRGKINFDDLNSDKKYDEGDAYAQSKLANILFTRELAKRLQGTGVTVNAVHPGLVNTEIARHMGFANSIIATVFFQPFVWLFLKTPTKGAQTTIYAALSPELENVSGKYFSNQSEAEVSEGALDEADAKRLWLTSERWTHVRDDNLPLIS